MGLTWYTIDETKNEVTAENKWIFKTFAGDIPVNVYECPSCKQSVIVGITSLGDQSSEYNYCPRCGHKID